MWTTIKISGHWDFIKKRTRKDSNEHNSFISVNIEIFDKYHKTCTVEDSLLYLVLVHCLLYSIEKYKKLYNSLTGLSL